MHSSALTTAGDAGILVHSYGHGNPPSLQSAPCGLSKNNTEQIVAKMGGVMPHDWMSSGK